MAFQQQHTNLLVARHLMLANCVHRCWVWRAGSHAARPARQCCPRGGTTARGSRQQASCCGSSSRSWRGRLPGIPAALAGVGATGGFRVQPRRCSSGCRHVGPSGKRWCHSRPGEQGVNNCCPSTFHGQQFWHIRPGKHGGSSSCGLGRESCWHCRH